MDLNIERWSFRMFFVFLLQYLSFHKPSVFTIFDLYFFSACNFLFIFFLYIFFSFHCLLVLSVMRLFKFNSVHSDTFK